MVGSAIDRVRAMCQERLEKEVAKGPISENYDLDVYRAGEIEGWRTCLRVLADVPPTHTPAQAVYCLAGFRADRSTKPKDRMLYDRERGFLDSQASGLWNLAWNRVILRVQGWLEAEYGPAEYEDVKDLLTPTLPYLDRNDPDYKRDLNASVKAMLGERAR